MKFDRSIESNFRRSSLVDLVQYILQSLDSNFTHKHTLSNLNLDSKFWSWFVNTLQIKILIYLIPKVLELINFILSDNGNCDFDVIVERCGFVGFVNDVIYCECLGCVFCFRIKEKKNDTFYINFYSIIFIQSCFLFILFHISIE